MTILLYDYCDLEERASKHLKAWKVWHIILFVSAAVFGLANYILLQKTMELVEHNCVFYPRSLDFHIVDLTTAPFNDTSEYDTPTTMPTFANDTEKVKRDTKDNETIESETLSVEGNATVPTDMPATGNTTHRLALVASRILPESASDCQFAEYMPLLSTVFAAVWVTMFTMCAGGGRVRTGLQQPWQLLTPALVFSLVMVGLTGRSFAITNGGLHAFCAGFHHLTNATTCSPVNEYLELGWNATWGFGGRASSTRGASAAVLASWVCAAALLLARCLAAPDFDVRRTGVYLKDPSKRLTPYLKKSRSGQQRSNPNSPRQREPSLRSEPTVTTELVTASVEPEDSAPTSLTASPLKITPVRHTQLRNTEEIELAYSQQERLGNVR